MFRGNCKLQGAYNYYCELPEDGDYAETRRRKLIIMYTNNRIVHLLVLITTGNSIRNARDE